MKDLSYKILMFALLVFTASFAQAQTLITPARKFIKTKYLKNEVSRFELSMKVKGKKMVRGVMEDAITLMPKSDQLLRVQTFTAGGRVLSVDSVIVTLNRFLPVYHAGTNPRRNIYLKYNYSSGKITGRYAPKKGTTAHTIDTQAKSPYFDSNVYEMMLRFLPLKEGFKAKFSAYAYEDKTTHGVRWYHIEDVTEAQWNHQACFVLTLKNDKGFITRYWIEKNNRKLHKYEITMPNGRKVKFERV